MEQNGVERNLAGVLQSREDHAGNPEEDDVVAGNQGVSRVEIFQLRGLVRPAQGRERPQRRAEPGVQRVLILVQVGAAALRAGGGRFLGDNHLAAVVAVVGRDAVAPPELTGDAPVLDVLHPVVVGLVHPLGDQLDFAVADNVDGRLCQRLHLDKPLLGDHRLDGGAAAVAGADIVGVLLDLDEIPLLLQVFDDGLSGLIAVHAGILAAGLGHGGVVVHHLDDRQVVAAADLIVVRVVRRGDLDDAGAELHVDIVVADNRNLAANQRQDDRLADQILVTLVLGVDRNSGIAEHRLRAGGGQNDLSAAVAERVAQVPEVARLLLILNLGVRDGGHAVRAPVDDAFALIDEALVVEVDKDLLDRLGAALIEGEALAVPVAGGAQLFELLDDAAAVLALPLPGALQKALAAQVLLGQALLLHRVDDLGLGGDGGVVGARQPERLIALHPSKADQDVLQRLVQRVAHVQLTGDVRGRDHDGVRFFIGIWLGVKIAAVQPKLVGAVLYLFWIVDFRKFFHRTVSSFFHFCSPV